MKVISPSDIKTNHDFPLLTNDCGYQTTVFANYAGALNPKTAPLTLAEVAALPTPPSGATSLPLTLGAKFVYPGAQSRARVLQRAVDEASRGQGTRNVAPANQEESKGIFLEQQSVPKPERGDVGLHEPASQFFHRAGLRPG